MLSFLQTLGIIILVVLFFNVMIFVHELGHFLAGKWRGAYIDRFQIWFGKPIWKKKIGGVEWGLGWIPAGGFVSLPQMEDMEAVEGESQVDKSQLKPLKPLDKIIIAAAGPLFSLLLAYVFGVMVFFMGKPVVPDFGTTIGCVEPDAPAAQAGILPGDTITAIDGQPVQRWMGNMEGVCDLIALSEHEKITLSVTREMEDGTKENLDIQTAYSVPESKWWQRGKLRYIGIHPSGPAIVQSVLPGSPAAKAGLHEGQEVVMLNGKKIYSPAAVGLAAKNGGDFSLTLRNPDGSTQDVTLTPEIPANWKGKEGAKPIVGIAWHQDVQMELQYPTPQEQVNQGFRFVGDTIAKVCAPGSSVGMEHLSGPIGIGNFMYRMLADDAAMGWRLVLWFAVILNVNLAILNILPLPVVDGGHVVLGFAEMIRRKPVSSKYLNWVFTVFIFLLLAFFLFVTFKDIGDMVGDDGKEKLPPAEFTAKAE